MPRPTNRPALSFPRAATSRRYGLGARQIGQRSGHLGRNARNGAGSGRGGRAVAQTVDEQVDQQADALGVDRPSRRPCRCRACRSAAPRRRRRPGSSPSAAAASSSASIASRMRPLAVAEQFVVVAERRLQRRPPCRAWSRRSRRSCASRCRARHRPDSRRAAARRCRTAARPRCDRPPRSARRGSGKCRYRVPMPTPARRATSSRDASGPRSAKTAAPAASRASRLRRASARRPRSAARHASVLPPAVTVVVSERDTPTSTIRLANRRRPPYSYRRIHPLNR